MIINIDGERYASFGAIDTRLRTALSIERLTSDVVGSHLQHITYNLPEVTRGSVPSLVARHDNHFVFSQTSSSSNLIDLGMGMLNTKSLMYKFSGKVFRNYIVSENVLFNGGTPLAAIVWNLEDSNEYKELLSIFNVCNVIYKIAINKATKEKLPLLNQDLAVTLTRLSTFLEYVEYQMPIPTLMILEDLHSSKTEHKTIRKALLNRVREKDIPIVKVKSIELPKVEVKTPKLPGDISKAREYQTNSIRNFQQFAKIMLKTEYDFDNTGSAAYAIDNSLSTLDDVVIMALENLSRDLMGGTNFKKYYLNELQREKINKLLPIKGILQGIISSQKYLGEDATSGRINYNKGPFPDRDFSGHEVDRAPLNTRDVSIDI